VTRPGASSNVSDTAQLVAAPRASESARSEALFRDALADRLAGVKGRDIVAAATDACRQLAGGIPNEADRRPRPTCQHCSTKSRTCWLTSRPAASSRMAIQRHLVDLRPFRPGTGSQTHQEISQHARQCALAICARRWRWLLRKLGWTTVDIEPVLLAAKRFRRLSTTMKIISYISQPNPRQLGKMRRNAVIRLANQHLAAHLL
jgi:hypothetical protein